MTLLCLVSLAMSRSRTSWAAFIGTVGLSAPFAVSSNPHLASTRIWRRISLGLVAAVGVLPFLLAPFAPASAIDDPLNGRLLIWNGALSILAQRPWTGYGYAAVWGRVNATLLPQIPITAHPSAMSAHNGVVDVATELGIPAAALACACLFAALSSVRELYARATSAFSLFALAFAVAFAFMSFGEAHLLRIHSFFWILFVGLTTAVRRSLDDAHPAAAA
jgi:O-antigen ligase